MPGSYVDFESLCNYVQPCWGKIEGFHLGLESFVCALYGKPKMTNVDDVRYSMFQQFYAPKRHGDPLEKIKGINPSSMPPCHAVLINKIKRVNYVATIWKNAALPEPCVVQPEGNGWVRENGLYQIKWFDGDMVPQSICQVLNKDTSPDYSDIDDNAIWGDVVWF